MSLDPVFKTRIGSKCQPETKFLYSYTLIFLYSYTLLLLYLYTLILFYTFIILHFYTSHFNVSSDSVTATTSQQAPRTSRKVPGQLDGSYPKR